MKMELRFQENELEISSNQEDHRMIVSGYVNMTNQLSEILGATKKFREKISKGAFSRSIQNNTRGVDFLALHDSKKILASTRNESLTLREDEHGLYMSAVITPTTYGKDTYELIKSGIFKNMSFGFRTVKDSWKSLSGGIYERTIEELELLEVSVVRDPAYSQSTIAARGIDVIEEVEIPDEIREETELMEELKEIILNINAKLGTLEEKIDGLQDFIKDFKNDQELDDDENVEKTEEMVEPEEPIKPTEPEVKEEVKTEETLDKEEPKVEEVKKSEDEPKIDLSEDEDKEKDKKDEDDEEEKRSLDLSRFKDKLNLLRK